VYPTVSHPHSGPRFVNAGWSLCGRAPVGIGHRIPPLLHRFSISPLLSFPRNGTELINGRLRTTDLSKKMDEVSGVKFGGKEMSREKAEMRVRSGNEHTHTPRTYTHAAILLILCFSPPFFPYLGVGLPHVLAATFLALIS
jgi:hypothetical protein